MGAKRLAPRWWAMSAAGMAVAVFALAAAVAAAGPDLRLVEAAKNKNSKTVRTLLAEHVDANAHQADGATALMWAAHWDDLDTATLLIGAGANVNAVNSLGVTPISLACTKGSVAMVNKLLQAGANPNVADWVGETPLMNCSRTGSEEAVKSLLAHGADANAKETWRGQTALMWAVAAKHPAVTEVLIEHGADVHARSKGGFTPLLFAAQQGDVDSAKMLLAAGANVNEATPEYGSAIVVAAASGQEPLALFLLDKGADPNLADGNGITALHYAVQRGLRLLTGYIYDAYNQQAPPNMPELAKALLAHGANPNARIKKAFTLVPFHTTAATIEGATPFFLAAVASDVGAMRILADGGADPLLMNSEKVTPLMMAAGGGAKEYLRTDEEQKNAFEAVKLATELGDDVNAVSRLGETALHFAAATGNDASVQFLVDKGAKLDVRDRTGQTPWALAAGIAIPGGDAFLARYHKSTADLLLKLGAKQLSYKDKDYQDSKAKNVAAQTDEGPDQ